MGEVIGLEHVRRSKRLFGILIDRYGLHYFLATNGEPHPLALDDRRFEQAVNLAAIWMEMQTDRTSDPTRLSAKRSQTDLDPSDCTRSGESQYSPSLLAGLRYEHPGVANIKIRYL